MSSLPLLLALALGARILYLHRNLSSFGLMRCRRTGWLSLELRRRAGLVRPGTASQAFPQPRECRVLALRFAGIPLWRQTCVVGLPLQVDSRIDQLDAHEFDHLFQGGFRLDAGPR